MEEAGLIRPIRRYVSWQRTGTGNLSAATSVAKRRCDTHISVTTHDSMDMDEDNYVGFAIL